MMAMLHEACRLDQERAAKHPPAPSPKRRACPPGYRLCCACGAPFPSGSRQGARKRCVPCSKARERKLQLEYNAAKRRGAP